MARAAATSCFLARRNRLSVSVSVKMVIDACVKCRPAAGDSIPIHLLGQGEPRPVSLYTAGLLCWGGMLTLSSSSSLSCCINIPCWPDGVQKAVSWAALFCTCPTTFLLPGYPSQLPQPPTSSARDTPHILKHSASSLLTGM